LYIYPTEWQGFQLNTSPFFRSKLSLPVGWLWKNYKNGNKHDEMMESCFKASPQLKTTLDNLQAEISKWQTTKEKFIRMRDAAQTGGGRALAEEKLTRVEQVLTGLNGSHNSVLEQVEMIAMESVGQFTDLDRRALEDLGHKVQDSVRDARELREGLSGD
jgi:hypothetical protein